MSLSFRSVISFAVASFACGCVGYRPCCVSAPAAEAEEVAYREAALPFDDAVRRLVERNPELHALRAEAAAVNLRPGPEPLELSTEIRDGRVTDTTIGTDVLALFGVGRTGAERALARSLQDEAWMRHHETARARVAELAEAYAVDRVLRGFSLPPPENFVAAFRAAGLVSDADVAAADAAQVQAAAETDVAASELRDVRREIANLLGGSPASEIVPLEVAEGWPAVPEPGLRDLLFARGDLQRLYAEYVTADRRFLLAVKRQVPDLVLRLGQDLDLKDPLQLIEVSIPLGAPAEARAAAAAREAAGRRFVAGVHAALHDAARARNEWAASDARVRAAQAAADAARVLVKATKTRLQVDASAVTDVVLVAGQAVTAESALRIARVEQARARVRAAKAAGWPGPEAVGACR